MVRVVYQEWPRYAICNTCMIRYFDLAIHNFAFFKHCFLGKNRLLKKSILFAYFCDSGKQNSYICNPSSSIFSIPEPCERPPCTTLTTVISVSEYYPSRTSLIITAVLQTVEIKDNYHIQLAWLQNIPPSGRQFTAFSCWCFRSTRWKDGWNINFSKSFQVKYHTRILGYHAMFVLIIGPVIFHFSPIDQNNCCIHTPTHCIKKTMPFVQALILLR